MVPAMGTLSNWISKIHNNKHSLVAVCAKPVGQALRPSKDQSDNSAGIYIDRRMQIALWFAGLRGAMSFALVSHVPLYDSFSGKGTRLKAEMKAMTSASIMFTVFILGGYTYYIMKQLGMSPQIAQPHETRGLMRKDRDDDYDYGDDDYDDEGLQNGIGLVPL